MLGFIPVFGMDTGQKIFREDVKSLKIYNPDNFLAPPVIRLNSQDKLNINFDILGEAHEYLRYRLIHCDADWQPSKILESEYIGGFNEVTVDDYAYSENTYIHYVNYNIVIPDNIQILKSGNYLLQVFPETDNSSPILQVRFEVSENLISSQGNVSSKTDKGINTNYQQIYLELDISNLPGVNPFQDLIVFISQNNNPETREIILNPSKVQGNKIVYDHIPSLIFNAGNEYRRFETVRTDYPGMNVDSVKFIDRYWHAFLQPDVSRKDKEHSFDQTQFGRFKIDEYNSSDPDLGADYVKVHFYFTPNESERLELYLDGEMTNHQYDDTNRMKYNPATGLYENELLLKQGSYNYQYIVRNGGKNQFSSSPIEGDKYETRNQYILNVYLRTPGSRYDRLILSSVL